MSYFVTILPFFMAGIFLSASIESKNKGVRSVQLMLAFLHLLSAIWCGFNVWGM